MDDEPLGHDAPVTWRRAIIGQLCEEPWCPTEATHVLVYANRTEEVLCATCAAIVARTYALGAVPDLLPS